MCKYVSTVFIKNKCQRQMKEKQITVNGGNRQQT